MALPSDAEVPLSLVWTPDFRLLWFWCLCFNATVLNLDFQHFDFGHCWRDVKQRTAIWCIILVIEFCDAFITVVIDIFDYSKVRLVRYQMHIYIKRISKLRYLLEQFGNKNDHHATRKRLTVLRELNLKRCCNRIGGAFTTQKGYYE